MKFKTNRDNNDYIMVNVRTDFPTLLLSSNLNISTDVINEINKIYFDSARRELNKELGLSIFPDEIAIRKDSLVGQFLLNNVDNKAIINLDEYISYNDVVNAYNIAIYEENCKMSNRLFFLFKDRSCGFVSELKEQKDEKAIQYIIENRDFDMYLKKKYNEYEPSLYVVYEDGVFSKKCLLEYEKVKVKKIGD